MRSHRDRGRAPARWRSGITGSPCRRQVAPGTNGVRRHSKHLRRIRHAGPVDGKVRIDCAVYCEGGEGSSEAEVDFFLTTVKHLRLKKISGHQGNSPKGGRA